jgi:hypothetical protein
VDAGVHADGVARASLDAEGEKEVQSRSRAEEAAGSVDVGALYAKLRSHLEPPTCVTKS